MSHYAGYYGKVIVREEFYYVIENRIDLTETTDPVFKLYDNLEDESRFDRGFRNLIWEKWIFDRESGSWEFRVEYNESHYGCPHVNLIDYFIPYISKEVIDIYSFDEYYPPPYKPISLTLSLRKQIEHREESIRDICEELNSLRK